MITFLYWFFENFCLPIKILAVLADTSIIVAVVKWIYGLTYCTIYLKIDDKIEKLELRRKYFTVQHLTNIVSREFYQGDLCDKTVRAQIIKLTSPRLKDEYQSEHFPFKLRHIIFVHWLVRKGEAFDLSSESEEAKILSLRNDTFPFSFKANEEDKLVECKSVSSLLQSLLCENRDDQVKTCGTSPTAIRKNHFFSPKMQFIYWGDKTMLRESYDYVAFIESILKNLYDNNSSFKEALDFTKGKKLFCSRGDHNPQKSFITERELCNALMQIRDNSDNKNECNTLTKGV